MSDLIKLVNDSTQVGTIFCDEGNRIDSKKDVPAGKFRTTQDTINGAYFISETVFKNESVSLAVPIALNKYITAITPNAAPPPARPVSNSTDMSIPMPIQANQSSVPKA